MANRQRYKIYSLRRLCDVVEGFLKKMYILCYIIYSYILILTFNLKSISNVISYYAFCLTIKKILNYRYILIQSRTSVILNKI